jgi:hypothetical protein
MDIFKPIKNIVKKVKEYMDEVTKEKQEQEKLEKWKKRLTNAISAHDSFRVNCAVWDSQYNSTRQVGPEIARPVSKRQYMSDRDREQGTKDARQVVNLTFQLIESQIDISVPKPNVEPCEYDYDQDEQEQERNRMIEGMLTYMADRPTIQRLVSENERITKKNGMCIYKVCYNPGYKSHKFVGIIETKNPHPCNIIPQPGVFRVEDMDYLFHIENRTLDYICRMYGEEWRDRLDGATTEFPNIDDLSSINTTTSVDNNGLLSVVECWYKDKDGDVGVMTWVCDVILRDVPKFFYKRDENGNLIEFDEIEVDPYEVPVIDEEGNLVYDENGTQVFEVKTTVQVPVHVPKRFPFVIQYNIPKEKSYYGKADPDIIYDQQEAIKKVLSDHEEKLIKGQSKIFVRKGENLTSKINDAALQIIEVEDPNSSVKVVDMKTPDQSLLEYYRVIMQAAKDALGVTEASQGRVDTGAEGGKADLSGRALEILAANTAGRLSVKAFEKQIAFTELYQLYFDFILAFYDDKRPYKIKGEDGKPIYGYFDKAKLIKQDDAGDWYYPEYDIQISIDAGLPKDKRFIMEAANGSGNRMDNIEYWQVMESIGFPMASEILKREQGKEQQAQLAQQVQQQAVRMPAIEGGKLNAMPNM